MPPTVQLSFHSYSCYMTLHVFPQTKMEYISLPLDFEFSYVILLSLGGG